jgi:hypothetical protein
MGFVMLGIATLTTIGIQAAIFGMVAHGVITGMLFFCVGSIYDRYHTREIAEIGGGMSELMPKMAGIFAFVAIASLGLPGLAGFIGEFMALLSSFSPARGAERRLYPNVHGRRRDRHDPDRRLLPVDAAAREPGRGAGEMARAPLPRHPRGGVGVVGAAARADARLGLVPEHHPEPDPHGPRRSCTS